MCIIPPAATRHTCYGAGQNVPGASWVNGKDNVRPLIRFISKWTLVLVPLKIFTVHMSLMSVWCLQGSVAVLLLTLQFVAFVLSNDVGLRFEVLHQSSRSFSILCHIFSFLIRWPAMGNWMAVATPPDRRHHNNCTVILTKAVSGLQCADKKRRSFFCYSDISAVIFVLPRKRMASHFPLNSQKMRFQWQITVGCI